MEKMYAEMLKEIGTNIVPKLNTKTEIQIIEHLTSGVFPTNFTAQTYRELCEVQINQRYEWNKNKLSSLYFWNNPFNYGMAIDDFLFEEINNYLYDFINNCVARKKYFEFLQEKLEFSGNEDDYHDSIVDFFCEFNFEKGIYQEHDTLPLWKENPTVEEICDKHRTKIQQYQNCRTEYWKKRTAEENRQMRELWKAAEELPDPNITQKITKNDKDLLKFLKEKYSSEEIGLLIWAKKLEVSNSVSMMFPSPSLNYPQSPPKLEDFIKN